MTHGARVRVTVLTCTYNRARTLPRLHRSLAEQTFRDFEWLVVDDGSTDGTAQLVSAWAAAPSSFPIRYLAKENGGKHTAHNLALPHIRGELCAIIDSDDWYLPGGLSDLVDAWQGIPAEAVSSYANVEGLVQTEDGAVLGPPFTADVFDSDNLSILAARPGQQDTRGMYRSSVLREYPFPEGPGFQFVPETLVWHRIARRYRSRFINKVVEGAEYQAGGLSDRYFELVLSSLAPHILHLQEARVRRVVAGLRPGEDVRQLPSPRSARGTLPRRLRETRRRCLAMLVLPLALLLFLRDRAGGRARRSPATAPRPRYQTAPR